MDFPRYLNKRITKQPDNKTAGQGNKNLPSIFTGFSVMQSSTQIITRERQLEDSQSFAVFLPGPAML
jgi:hypothetical protein